MATIIVESTTDGESALTATVKGADVTYTDEIEAIGIHDNVSGAYGTGRGTASEIQLVRYRDRASPKLAELCSSGDTLGSTVDVSIFENDEGLKLLMKFTLSSVFVSRIEMGTVDSKGVDFQRHEGQENTGKTAWLTAESEAMGHTLNDAREHARARGAPKPAFDGPPGNPTDVEVERVWLNYSSVIWESADGNITGNFNNRTGRSST